MAQTKSGSEIVAAQRAGIDVSEYRKRIASGLKKCTRCKTWTQNINFCSDVTRWDSLSAVCNSCRRVKVRKSRNGIPSSFKGRHHTKATRKLLSKLAKGRPGWFKGKHWSLEERERLSKTVSKVVARGRRHYAWKNGSAQRRKRVRESQPYKAWRTRVFFRDGFLCKSCGDARGGNLQAHHIKPYSSHPKLRFDVSNGLTLCVTCHRKVHAHE